MTAPTILLASDLSARCDRATDRAFLVADQIGATITLLHVAGRGASEQDLLARAGEAIESTFGHHASRLNLIVKSGRVEREILATAEALAPRLIVTGVSRFNSVQDHFLGTAVDHLVRHAEVPVLVVKRRATRPYRRILVATDFSAHSLEAVQTALALFPDEHVELLHCCHSAYAAWLDEDETAREVRRQAQEEMQAFLGRIVLDEGRAAPPPGRVALGDTQACLTRAMREGGFDLLVMGTHGRSGLGHAALGSCASSMLTYADADVLVVRRIRR